MVVVIVELLFKVNWVKWVFFLADCSVLVKQVKKVFKQYIFYFGVIDFMQEKEEMDICFVFFIYFMMMNCIDGVCSGDVCLFMFGYFDFIIVDEAYCLVYQKYNVIFEYFDVLLLGLIVMFKDQVDKDIYELFDCEVCNFIFFYDIEEVVCDGYLVLFWGEKVNFGFVCWGIYYNDFFEEE